jgi:MFS transporter, SP family, sugar:H+ symporter
MLDQANDDTGWGPTPFILSSECSPNHVRSLVMAASLMTQWLFNFIIAKITPIMLADITYGTFLLFGSLCLVMGIWTVFCVPETKGVPLESIGELFEGNIIRGCIQDTVPKRSRARRLRHHHNTNDVDSVTGDVPNKGGRVDHIEDA